jgi:hypothetical protein
MSQSAIWSAHFSPVMAGVSTAIAVGDVLTRLPGAGGGYVLATTANLVTGLRARCIAITSHGGGPGTVLAVSHGEVDNARTGLGAGASGLVYVSALGRLTRTQTGIRVGWCDTEGNALLDFSFGTAAGAVTSERVVNIMDYWEDGDGSPSLTTAGPGGTAITTRRILPAFQRAFAAKIATKEADTLWIPPCSEYGVQAWSMRDAITIDTSSSGANLASFHVLGCGDASKIIIERVGAGTDEKIYLAGAGPSCMSQIVTFRHLFFLGDNTVTDDCATIIRTSVDQEVLYEDCAFYSVRASAAAGGTVYGDAMGITFRRCYWHFCTNSASDGAAVAVGTGTFGALFEHCNWYSWEHSINPFGGANYDKGAAQSAYGVALLGGGAPYTLTRAKFVHCTWAENGRWGAVLAKPGSLSIDTVHFDQCSTYSNARRLIEARSNVRHIIVENTELQHNAADDAIELMASTCERLTMRNVRASHSGILYTANTGQKSVIVESCEGGTYDLTGAKYVSFDAASTPHAITAGTETGWERAHKLAAVSVNAAAANMLNVAGAEVSLISGKAYMVTLRVTGGRTDAGAVRGCIERKLLVHTNGGAATIVNDTALYSQLAAGWAVTVSAPGGLTLRVAVNGAAGETVQFGGIMEALEVDAT